MPTRKTENSQSEQLDEDAGESKVAAISVGSPNHQGVLTAPVDLGQGGGAKGFIGKASEISWLERCREHISSFSEKDSKPPCSRHEVYTFPLKEVNYYTDDVDLLAIDEDAIDELRCPSISQRPAYVMSSSKPFITPFHFSTKTNSLKISQPSTIRDRILCRSNECGLLWRTWSFV